MPEHSGESITIMKVDPIDKTATLAPRSPGQAADGRLSERHSAYFDNISPAIEWDPVPGAGAYALIVEDPDAPRELPFLHWLLWNIPAGTTRLEEGVPNEAYPANPPGSMQGRNDAGTYGWYGPRPPAGHGPHRYYFQLFALAEPLEMGSDTPLNELLNALKGDTLAKGEMVATFEAPTAQ
jgi:Raf kinase inhibitor-like YbhB/YbcL family protein